jgi:hypothetical protein
MGPGESLIGSMGAEAEAQFSSMAHNDVGVDGISTRVMMNEIGDGFSIVPKSFKLRLCWYGMVSGDT